MAEWKKKLNFAAYNDKKVYLQATETMDIRPVKNVSENILNQLEIYVDTRQSDKCTRPIKNITQNVHKKTPRKNSYLHPHPYI